MSLLYNVFLTCIEFIVMSKASKHGVNQGANNVLLLVAIKRFTEKKENGSEGKRSIVI